ncbi:DotU family type IV/VI secretion system protein [Massilia sp. CMS3.1]|uniref:DotU family type IV/VI secretion system protein n=1 Tax=Massilia sp. CMS3.1 TaxID=3373083 RepID=UPI003EE61C28
MTIHDKAQRAGDADGNDLASSQFRAFVAVLTQARAHAANLAEAEGRTGAAALSRELCQLIELQSLEAGRRGGKGSLDTQLQARFVKAALADEMMLNTNWAGRTHWRHQLVESALLQSAHAGQQVFDDIDQLLRERDPARRAVARLYLHLLALGFQGRYRGSADLAPIAAYRGQLFQFAYQRAPGLGARDAVLTEQTYASTLSSATGQRLSKPSRRVAMLALSLAGLLVLSQSLWLWQSWPVRQALKEPARLYTTQQQGMP